MQSLHTSDGGRFIPSLTHGVSGTFIDLFAGCGGLSLGLMEAGWRGLFAIEKDDNAFASLEHNLIRCLNPTRFAWPEWLPKSSHNIDDVLSRYESQLLGLRGTVDMVVGGPPCQGFSSAGRRNAADPRNALVDSYLEFVSLIQPKLVLIENVKGISLDFSKTVKKKVVRQNFAQKIIDTLSRDYNVEAKLINTWEFGVPQKRQRFFIVATSKKLFVSSNSAFFDELERQRESFLKSKGINSVPVASRSAISDLEVRNNGTEPSEMRSFLQISYHGPQTVYQRLMHGNTERKVSDTRLARHKPAITQRFSELISLCTDAGRLNTSLSSAMRASFGLKKCAIRVLDPDAPSPTITSMPDDLIHYSEPRTLTVRENARLQSFPDHFEFKGKYTTGGNRRRKEVPRFTQVANAVPPLVAEAFGTALYTWLLRGSFTSSTVSPYLEAPRPGFDNPKVAA